MTVKAAIAMMLLLTPVSCPAAPLEQQFDACLQETMRAYPAVDPHQDFIWSQHTTPSSFSRYLSTCMRAKGFIELEQAKPKCLDPSKLENEAFCFAKP